MPLTKGRSKESMSRNIKTEMHHGKPQDQAVAIAYALKRKAREKMAQGGKVSEHSLLKGELKPFNEEEHYEHDLHGNGFHEDEVDDHEKFNVLPDKFSEGGMAGSAPTHPLDMMFRKRFLEGKKMAYGGHVEDEDEASQDYPEFAEVNREQDHRAASEHNAPMEHEADEEDHDRMAFTRSYLTHRAMRR